MCNLSASQVLASAMNKAGSKHEITLVQLVKYNRLLLEQLPDYFGNIDLTELAFELQSVATEFEIVLNDDYERVIRLRKGAKFDYALYEKTFPDGVANCLANIELPNRAELV